MPFERLPRLLVVEDEELLARALVKNLDLEGYRAHSVGDAETAIDLLERELFDLLILDVQLPGINGLELLASLRQRGFDRPVLVLTARGSEGDRIAGLQLGADDYLTKPFVFEELELRIRRILERSGLAFLAPQRITIAGCPVDLTRAWARTRAGDEVRLTEHEVGLISNLLRGAGEPVDRGDLLEAVWGYDRNTATRTLDTFIHRLRGYFELDPHHPECLLTVRGVGYTLIAEIDEG